MSVTRRGLRNLPKYQGATVKAGILEGATYPADMLRDARTGKERPDPRAGMHVATIAAALEYGHSQNHPRPFMQNTVAQYRKAWAAGIMKLITGGMTIRDALLEIGLVMKEDIRFTISEWPADNSAEWAAFKGFNKGLSLTSHLYNSVEAEIEEPK